MESVMIDLHGIAQDTFDDGIGYDLGQATKAQIAADWKDRVQRQR
jgi:hypothetical protein